MTVASAAGSLAHAGAVRGGAVSCERKSACKRGLAMGRMMRVESCLQPTVLQVAAVLGYDCKVGE